MALPLLWIIGGALAGAALVAGAEERKRELATIPSNGDGPDPKHAEALIRRVVQTVLYYEHLDHYEDETFLHEYALANRAGLLADRAKILAEHQGFIGDFDFIRCLRRQSPETYERACWKVKALKIAELLSSSHRPDVWNVGPSPRAARPAAPVEKAVIDITPKKDEPKKQTRKAPQWRAAAQQAQDAIRDKAGIEMAKLRASLDVQEKVRRMLRNHTGKLDDDDVDRLVSAFMEELSGSRTPGRKGDRGHEQY